MLMTDLGEVKSVLEIDPDNKAEDKKLWFLIEWVSALIEECVQRPNLSKKERTEYYNGTGTRKLVLRSRPVFTTPTPLAYYDEGGLFGAASGSFDSTTTALTYGTDFGLAVDQEDGTSRSAVLVRNNSVWHKRHVRQAGYLTPFLDHSFGVIKVVYTAGYTVDTLPAVFRAAAALLLAKMRHMLPLGVELTSESYEERAIGWSPQQKDYLMGLVRPMLFKYRNWSW